MTDLLILADRVEGLSVNDRHLVALLRREATYSGVWFSDKLHEAADLIERLASPRTIAANQENDVG